MTLLGVVVTAWVLAADSGKVLSLEDALRTADAHQPALRAAHADTEAARARADEVRAGLLPQLGLNANYRVGGSGSLSGPSTTVGSSGAPGTASFGTNGLTVSATGSQLLWDFGQTWNRFRAQGQLADAQALTERGTVKNVHFTVRSAYFTARAEKALVQVAHETLANEDKHLAQVTGFVQVGTRPEIDLAQEKTTRANALVQSIQAENNYETGKAQLNQAIGVEGNTDYDVEDVSLSAVPGEDLSTDVLLDEALGARPDYLAFASQVRAQELTRSAVRGAFLPTLNLSGGISDLVTRNDPFAYSAFGQLTLQWSFFSGLSTVSTEREVNAALVGLQARRDTERLQVRLEVEQARLAVRAARAATVAVKEAVTNARERLRLAEGRYQTGVGSVIELGDAQVALNSSAAQNVQADYTLSSARAQLIRALGRE